MIMLDMQQGQAALHFKDMQHGRAEERKMQKDVRCSIDMDMQHRYTGRIAALTCSFDMRQGHEPRTCGKDMQQGHAAKMGSMDMRQGCAA
jgi:hypothetical protein